MINRIPYNPKLKALARELRNNSTLGEVLLWMQLRNGQMIGYDFHRQKPLLDFIVDFYCYELRLVIEIDGNSHHRSDVQKRDLIKSEALEAYELTILRFSEKEVRFEMNMVLRKIEDYILNFQKL